MAWYPNQYGYMQPSYGAAQPVNYGGAVPQQSYQAAPQQAINPGIIWVDGEVGAKAFQMPAGVSGPVALWDTNDQMIYLKSTNQMGMPNPLQKIRYQMEETPLLAAGQQTSGAANANPNAGTESYVTKRDLEDLKNEIRDMIQQNQTSGNQNGGNSAGNQNGNRGGAR